MTDFLDRWAAESPENARLVAQERLITQTTEALWQEMEEAGVDKADLAARNGLRVHHQAGHLRWAFWRECRGEAVRNMCMLYPVTSVRLCGLMVTKDGIGC